MSDINRQLFFLNRNLDIQIEQHKLSNLLLHNIIELLRVPDSEKERQHSIELVIKFFVNASKDPDLYTDSLDELLKAESLMKQDYFVLNRIGCIYLYIEKFIDLEKALDYFLRAAKYASVESAPQASVLANILGDNSIRIDFESEDSVISSKKQAFNIIIERGEMDVLSWGKIVSILKKNLKDFRLKNKDQVWFENKNQDYVDQLGESINVIEGAGGKVEIIDINGDPNKTSDFDVSEDANKASRQIGILAADSFEKAAFTSYVLGNFSDAVYYQSKALDYNNSPRNRFFLAKYQIRGGEISEGIENLNLCITQEPIFLLACFKEIDLINEAEVLKLINQKNQQIDLEIQMLVENLKKINSLESQEISSSLMSLLSNSYEIKVSNYGTYLDRYNSIEKNHSSEVKKQNLIIDQLERKYRNSFFKEIDKNEINLIHQEIENLRQVPTDMFNSKFKKIENSINQKLLEEGSQYGGGTVFYIDKAGQFALVCSITDLEQSIWGGFGETGANGRGFNSGPENTDKIAEKARIKNVLVKSGWFSKKYEAIKIDNAASICQNCRINGFGDWYLPTMYELNLIYTALSKKRNGKSKIFKSGFYWSSEELNTQEAKGFNLNEGKAEYNLNKETEQNIIVVRKCLKKSN
jgi:hypothetical protein